MTTEQRNRVRRRAEHVINRLNQRLCEDPILLTREDGVVVVGDALLSATFNFCRVRGEESIVLSLGPGDGWVDWLGTIVAAGNEDVTATAMVDDNGDATWYGPIAQDLLDSDTISFCVELGA